ncbi:hypothetical protein P1X14_08400 [Sphingomonas sp. AOB5]|uniref:hypothetical protein n=1 Tax=Sphingomonas sp. AOB5 TaxID=3034017 RepID=UPI0023F6D5DD|nr:hypothetical protein [Sphingomonas sp. AOB5]MDF7775264.1 hypothetical protein [Sphingomonas sp. AOB5]
MRGPAILACLTGLMVAPGVAAQTAPRASVFDYIKAADVVSGRIELDELIDEDPVESEPGVFKQREGEDVTLREAKMCDLNRSQIERLIAVLKRARASKEMRDGLGADMVIRFVRPGRTDLVAVISSPEEEGRDTEIFFGGRLALLDPVSLAAVHAVAEEAGCSTGLEGE